MRLRALEVNRRRERKGVDAKTFLSGAFCMELQVRSKQEQIEALRSLASKVTQTFGGEPVSHTRNVTSMQDTVAKILAAEEELNRRIDQLVDQKLQISRVIDCVQNVSYRLILEERYILFKQWDEIAEDLGLTARWLQVKHQEALDAVQEILDGMEG